MVPKGPIHRNIKLMECNRSLRAIQTNELPVHRCEPEPAGWYLVLMPAALAATPGPQASSPLLQHPTHTTAGDKNGAIRRKIHSTTFINNKPSFKSRQSGSDECATC